MKRAFLYVAYIMVLLSLSQLALANSVSIPFYNDSVNVSFDAGILNLPKVQLKAKKIDETYLRYQYLPFESLISSIKSYQKAHQLNDWFYYKILETTINKLYPEEKPSVRTSIVWYCMLKSKYDVRYIRSGRKSNISGAISYRKKAPYYCTSKNFRDRGKVFLTLSHNDSKHKSGKSIMMYKKKDRLMSFSMDTLPIMKPDTVERVFQFYANGVLETITVKLDKTLIDMQRDLPNTFLGDKFTTPLSPMAANSLLPQLRRIIAGKDTLIAARLILAFVRESFTYKTDEDHFGFEKELSPEEALYYRYSDCEDRSSLYFYLVKELLNVPVATISYIIPNQDGHCSIAIGGFCVEDYKPLFVQDSIEFWMAEPTDLGNTLDIGEIPKEFARKHHKVVRVYIPQADSLPHTSQIP